MKKEIQSQKIKGISEEEDFLKQLEDFVKSGK